MILNEKPNDLADWIGQSNRHAPVLYPTQYSACIATENNVTACVDVSVASLYKAQGPSFSVLEELSDIPHSPWTMCFSR